MRLGDSLQLCLAAHSVVKLFSGDVREIEFVVPSFLAVVDTVIVQLLLLYHRCGSIESVLTIYMHKPLSVSRTLIVPQGP